MINRTRHSLIEQEPWTLNAQYFEYSRAANPIASGQTSQVPFADFPSRLHRDGPTRIIPFDLSKQLRCSSPATSPALCANFLRIQQGERIETNPNATSEVYYVIRGEGRTQLQSGHLPWQEGDFFALPAGSQAEHRAETDAALYWVHDEPLLRYLGARAAQPRFEPTLYPRDMAAAALSEVALHPKAKERSRLSILLANQKFAQTRTITHVLWTMFGELPKDTIQLPHRHDSVALDYIVDCLPGCFTLVGRDVDRDGHILNPRRVDWHPGSAFVTPPGLWHAHYNESGAVARLIPMQDAGLHTYLRTLNIQFYHPNHQSIASNEA